MGSISSTNQFGMNLWIAGVFEWTHRRTGSTRFQKVGLSVADFATTIIANESLWPDLLH